MSLPTDFFWGKNKRDYTTLDFRDFFGLSECTLENIRDFDDAHIQEFRSLNYKYDDQKMKDKMMAKHGISKNNSENKK